MPMVTAARVLLLHPLQTAHLTAHTKLMNTVTILKYATTTVSYCQHCMDMEERREGEEKKVGWTREEEVVGWTKE